MDKTPATVTASETDDAATFKVVLEIEGVLRNVALTVSPRPTEAEGWAIVVKALSDFMSAHPERF
jgi:hypothetical protein